MQKILTLLILFVTISLPFVGHAKDLRVTVIEREPFVKIEDGKYSGFSIDLWEAIAKNRGWTYKYEPVNSFIELLRAPRTATSDLAIANISITTDREEVMDFSTPIFDSGLQIMASNDKTNNVLSLLFNKIVGLTFSIAIIVLFIVANLMWYFEKVSKKHTCKSYKKTIFEAVWCVATLGRFNKHIPVSTAGRIIFVLWTFIILILFSLLTAQFSVKLMQNNVADSINSFYDLRGKKVGTTAGSTSEIFLSKNKIKTISYNNTKELFNDVANGKLDAAVHDAPLIQYYVANDGFGKVRTVGSIFQKDSYAIALPSGSSLRSEINIALLTLRENGTYEKIYNKWFK